MVMRFNSLRHYLNELVVALSDGLGRVLGVAPARIDWGSLRNSFDARDKDDVHFVFTAEVRLPDEKERVAALARKRRGPARVELHDEPPFSLPEPGSEPLRERPVVIGSGPGGLVAASFLALQGYAP